MWAGDSFKFARCPRCYRQDLTTWSLEYYHPPTSTALKLKMGANAVRCAACRCNFASFRPIKAKFRVASSDAAGAVDGSGYRAGCSDGISSAQYIRSPGVAQALGASNAPVESEAQREFTERTR